MARARIVIPALDNEATIGEVLDAAVPQAPVTVVDNRSRDRTVEIARAKGARVLTVPVRSAAVARNAGWRDAADAEHVLFLDSDAVPEPRWAERLTDRLSRGDADVVGGDIVSHPQTRVGRAYDRMYRALDAALFADGSVMLPAMNLGVRADLLGKVAFDETIPGASCEDVDFLTRAKAAGVRIAFVPDARVAHRHPETLRAFLRQEVRHGEGRALYLARHPEAAAESPVRSWPAWAFDATVKAPWHLEHARRRAGFDPAVMTLHWLRMAAGHWGFLRAQRRATAERF